jgi:hypothetical protein
VSIGQILALTLVAVVGGGFLGCAAGVAMADLLDLRRRRWHAPERKRGQR